TNISVFKTGTGSSTVTGNYGNLQISSGTVTMSGVSVFNNFDLFSGSSLIIQTGGTTFFQFAKFHANTVFTFNGNLAWEGCQRDPSLVVNGTNSQAIAGFNNTCTSASTPH